MRYREINHFSELRNNKHHSIHLQRAYNKNPDVFKFVIVEECDNLEERERYYMDLIGNRKNLKVFIKRCYNIKPDSIKGFCMKHSAETVLKLKNIIHTKERIEKMIKTKSKMPILHFNEYGILLNEYLSAEQVDKKLGYCAQAIRQLCKNKTYIAKLNRGLFCFKQDITEFNTWLNNQTFPIVYIPHNKKL